MKRPMTILLITLLTILVIYACGSTIRTATTSFVTITIGEDAHIAKLKAEKATVLARTRYLLAELKLMPEAQAYIPSVVQVLVVTVSAADISTPIVGIDSIKTGQTTATVRIEVPNGNARQFTVEGIRGVDSKTYYRGIATADLTGADVNMPVTMNFVGPGIYVDPAQPLTANTSTCGSTPAGACATITYALNSRTTGTDAILALAGNYNWSAAASQETFPLQLKTGNALLCIGTNYGSLLNLASMTSGTVAVKGAEGASIDNCRIVGLGGFSSYVGIDDRQGATVLNKGITINNVMIEMPFNSSGSAIGIALYSDSPVIESTITGTGSPSPINVGIQVNSGKPTIQASTIKGLVTGINLTAGAGAALITGATITGNSSVGISVGGTGQPTITASQITNNGTGIQISAGNPSVSSNIVRNNTGTGIAISGSANGQLTGNTIDHNNNGITMSLATGANPKVNGNSIYCNTVRGADISATTTIDLTSNAWNRDATTSLPGPIINTGNCFNGDDICYAGPAPTYIPFSAAAAGGCP